MLLKQLFILFISCFLLACASAPEDNETVADDGGSNSNDCIHKPSIRGYIVLDEQNLIVDASSRRSYHVVLRRKAYGLQSSLFIEFETTTSRVCARFDGIRYDDGMSRDIGAIRIASIRELGQEDKDHLLIQYGRKKPEIEQTPAPQDVKGAEVEELDEAARE
ncbi:MAG: hypothetical protein KC572_01660 [Gammaproteobacteria bacterium]|nr:hypothetical protein [Gammaproteobacteria bacterium]